MSGDPIAIVRDFVAAWSRRDRDAIVAALDPHIVLHGIPMPPVEGCDAAMDLLDGFLAADEIDWRIVHIAAAGRVVLTERVDRFRFGGRAWSAVRAAGVFELNEDGRIAAWRDYFDMAELVGAIPPAEPEDE